MSTVGLYAVVFGCSLLTSVPWLGRVGGWLDEGATMSAARRDPGGLWSLVMHHDAALGAYYAVTDAWMSVVGTSLTSARALSAVCMAVASVIVVDCGRVIGGRVVGCVAGAQMLLLPGVDWAGFDARPTAMSTVLVCLALRLLLGTRSKVPSPWFYGVMVIAAWIQLTTVLQVLATFRRGSVRHPAVWIRGLLTGLCVLPVAWMGHQQAAQISWIHSGLGSQLVSVFVGRFADSPKSTTYLATWVNVSSAVLGVVYLVACVVAIAVLRSQLARLLGFWAFGPAAIAVLVGLVTGATIYLPRYFAATLPAAMLLTSLLLRHAWSTGKLFRTGAVLVSAVILCLCAPSLAAARVANGKWGENNEQVAQDAAARNAPVIWIGNALSVELTYPQLIRQPDQFPQAVTALRSDTLWARPLDAGDVRTITERYARTALVTSTSTYPQLERRLPRGRVRDRPRGPIPALYRRDDDMPVIGPTD